MTDERLNQHKLRPRGRRTVTFLGLLVALVIIASPTFAITKPLIPQAVAGIVTDAESGAGISGIVVTLLRQEESGTTVVESRTTSDDGLYVFPAVFDGKYFAELTSPTGTWVQKTPTFIVVENSGITRVDFDVSFLVDTDGDGIGESIELILGTNPLKSDSDDDGMMDSFEAVHGLDPNNPDDATIDSDGDGRSNLDEYLERTNPFVADSSEASIARKQQIPDSIVIQAVGAVNLDLLEGASISYTHESGQPSGNITSNVDGLAVISNPPVGGYSVVATLEGFVSESKDFNYLGEGRKVVHLAVQTRRLDLDFDGDGLTNIEEALLITSGESPDSDGDGFYDDIELAYGTRAVGCFGASTQGQSSPTGDVIILAMTVVFLVSARACGTLRQSTCEEPS